MSDEKRLEGLKEKIDEFVDKMMDEDNKHPILEEMIKRDGFEKTKKMIKDVWFIKEFIDDDDRFNRIVDLMCND